MKKMKKAVSVILMFTMIFTAMLGCMTTFSFATEGQAGGAEGPKLIDYDIQISNTDPKTEAGAAIDVLLKFDKAMGTTNWTKSAFNISINGSTLDNMGFELKSVTADGNNIKLEMQAKADAPQPKIISGSLDIELRSGYEEDVVDTGGNQVSDWTDIHTYIQTGLEFTKAADSYEYSAKYNSLYQSASANLISEEDSLNDTDSNENSDSNDTISDDLSNETENDGNADSNDIVSDPGLPDDSDKDGDEQIDTSSDISADENDTDEIVKDDTANDGDTEQDTAELENKENVSEEAKLAQDPVTSEKHSSITFNLTGDAKLRGMSPVQVLVGGQGVIKDSSRSTVAVHTHSYITDTNETYAEKLADAFSSDNYKMVYNGSSVTIVANSATEDENLKAGDVVIRMFAYTKGDVIVQPYLFAEEIAAAKARLAEISDSKVAAACKTALSSAISEAEAVNAAAINSDTDTSAIAWQKARGKLQAAVDNARDNAIATESFTRSNGYVQLDLIGGEDWINKVTSVSVAGQALSVGDYEFNKDNKTLRIKSGKFTEPQRSKTYNISIASTGYDTVSKDVEIKFYGAQSFQVRSVDKDGNVLKSRKFTLEELKAMSEDKSSKNKNYTTSCSMTGLRTFRADGVYLEDLMAAAGIECNPETTTVKLRTNDSLEGDVNDSETEDGYYTRAQTSYTNLMQPRYTFPSLFVADSPLRTTALAEQSITDAMRAALGADSGKVEVKPMIAYQYIEKVFRSDNTAIDDNEQYDENLAADKSFRLLFGTAMDSEDESMAAKEVTTWMVGYQAFGIDFVDENAGSGDTDKPSITADQKIALRHTADWNSSLTSYRGASVSVPLTNATDEWANAVKSIKLTPVESDKSTVTQPKSGETYPKEVSFTNADKGAKWILDGNNLVLYRTSTDPVVYVKEGHEPIDIAGRRGTTRYPQSQIYKVEIQADGYDNVTGFVTYYTGTAPAFSIIVDENGTQTTVKSWTSDEIQSMAEFANGSSQCGMTGFRSFSGEGVSLTKLLELAGVTVSEDDYFLLDTSDHYGNNFTYDELFGTDRYFLESVYNDAEVKALYNSLVSSDQEAGETAELRKLLAKKAKIKVEPRINVKYNETLVEGDQVGNAAVPTAGNTSYSNLVNYENQFRFFYGIAITEEAKVAFNTNGGSDIAAQYIKTEPMTSEENTTMKSSYWANSLVIYRGKGAEHKAEQHETQTAVTRPADPTKSGYTFGGWYTDEECTAGNEFDFNKAVEENVTLYAKWIQNSGGGSSSGGSGSSGGNSGSANTGGNNNNTSGSKDPNTVITKDSEGNVTETTTKEDGSTVAVETKTDGTVITTEKNADGSESVVQKNTDGSQVETQKTANGIESVKNTSANGDVTVSVNIPNSAVNSNSVVKVPVSGITASSDSSKAAVVSIKTPENNSVKVNIPVNNVKTSTIAVLVKADGTEEIIKTSVIDAGGVQFNVTDGSAEIKIIDNAKTFSDVSSGYWANDDIDYVTSREIFNGTGAEQFTPNGAMTRGMLAMVLHNIENNVSADNPNMNLFNDVASGHWAANAISWAAERGIITGYGSGAFGVDDQITREQLATILFRYAGGAETSNSALSGFSDSSAVSGYASSAMAWAVQNGLINGMGDGTLNPKGSATRAQVAAIIHRFNVIAK